jgi:hypothetical protein
MPENDSRRETIHRCCRSAFGASFVDELATAQFVFRR